MNGALRIGIIALFLGLATWSGLQLGNMKFEFSLEQFFPQNDPDLDYFYEFIKDFESDDNFLLIGFENNPNIFDQSFLKQIDQFTLEARSLSHVISSNSVTNFNLPRSTPFGLRLDPIIDIEKPDLYDEAKKKIQNDERVIQFSVSENLKTAAVILRTINNIDLVQSEELINEVKGLIATMGLKNDHILGRAFFQTEMVRMQKNEIIRSSMIAGFIVVLVMLFLFRKMAGVMIAITSIGVGMALFIGYMTLSGRPFDAMVGLYPILMIIVGTSDVIHIMNRYIAEQNLGKSRNEAIRVTIKEIGLATLYTSLTTAIGFGTLATSRIQPIQSFGLNASIGVMIAYVTVIFFTTSLLTFFDADQLSSFKKGDQFWSKWMRKTNEFTIRHPKRIGFSLLPLLLICGIGISLISTNYTLESNLPMRSKITKDYLFFEDNFAGFRPIELAVTAQDTFEIHDYAVMKEIAKAEDKLRLIDCASAIMSPVSIYKSIGQMLGGNLQENYLFPENEKEYNIYKNFATQIPIEGDQILISSDKKRARVTSRFDDIGADSIKQITDNFESWLALNTDPDVVQFKVTGTAMIFDKNVVYVRESLIKGLGLAVVIVSLLMVFLFRNVKIIIISLIPNLLPLLIAAALIGFIGIELEAGISIIFAMVFGIAVDDTIHFLSKYRITRQKGFSIDESIERTFHDTGKAICFTSIILFFGFMVMLFSVHPPSLSIGLMISLTLITALLCDLLFIPVLLRWLMPSKKEPK